MKIRHTPCSSRGVPVAFLSLVLIGASALAQAPNPGAPAGMPPQGPGGAGGPGGRGAGGAGGRGGGMVPFDFTDRTGYKEIFNGRDLEGWDYAPSVFRVENGEIVAGGIAGVNPGTTFATYKGAEPADFDFTVDIMTTGTNTGIQFRSFQNDITTPAGGPAKAQQFALGQIDGRTLPLQARVATARTAVNQATFAGSPNPEALTVALQSLAAAELELALTRATEFNALQSGPNRLNEQHLSALRTQAGRGGPMVAYAVWNVAGYQADFPLVGNIWEGGRFSGGGGQINERGNLTTGGNITITDAAPNGRTHRVLATLPTSDANGPFFKQNEWNTYRVMARGNFMALYLNGHMVSATIDENPVMSRAKGIIALQIEGQGPVRYKNIWLREVKVEMGPTPTR